MRKKDLRNCTVSILGDSYSTFQGHIPDGRNCYYPSPERVKDVLRVEDTWWYPLFQNRNMRLLLNDSWSGSTVCRDVRDTLPAESAFVERMKMSLSPAGIDGEKPDCIFLFGTTNDSWLGREIGLLTYDNWSDKELRQVLPAYCCMLDYVLRSNPQAAVFSIVNTQLDERISQGILEACAHYDVTCIMLHDIDKENGHPSCLGMQQIADQVNAALDNI